MARAAILLLAIMIVGPPNAVSAPGDSLAWWIIVDDAYLMPDVDDAVAARALERRARRGTGDVSVQRISDEVVTDLVRRGFDVRLVSHLIGAVSVVGEAHRLADLRQLPYSREVRPMRSLRRSPDPVSDTLVRQQPPGKTSDTTPDPGFSTDYLTMINALDPIGAGINGSGIWLGFLDTEFGEFSHEAFSHHRNDGRIAGEFNFSRGPQTNRHGLMVASAAAGRVDGVLLGPAFGATLIGAVTEYAPSETRAEEEYFVAGLEYLEAQGVDVVNVSLGYTGFDDDEGYRREDLDGETGVTTIAVQRATEMGVVVVVSAGNDACSSPALCWYYVGTPADARGAIAVGAVDELGQRAGFSSFGPTADGRIKPDVAAPGVRVPVAVGSDQYALSSGTSFAAPLVAGVVSQLLQVNGDLGPGDVLDILRSTASQSESPDNALGWGIIDAGAAIDVALRLRETPPPPALEFSTPHPNPTSGAVRVEVNVPASGFSGEILLFDALGRQLRQIHRGTLSPGLHSFTLDLSSHAPGLYFVSISGEGVRRTGSVVVIR